MIEVVNKNPLDKEKILSKLSNEFRSKVVLEVFDTISSTNDYLLRKEKNENKDIKICIAEEQTKGRGRRGKSWISPKFKNIYFSLNSYLEKEDLSGLSIAVALSVSKVLTKINVMSLIKWPNDLLVGNKKICGILIETAKVGELTKVVIGIGINVNMEYSELIDQEWTSIKLEKKQSVDRNSIITEMINQLCITLNKYEQEGFDYFLNKFTSLDLLKDKEFTLKDKPNDTFIGKGIDKKGLLIAQNLKDQRIVKFSSGEVSLKLKK
ncbi:biotin--[acetyl-CoA-carboxylase] ligase [SAR86 cluster bacterium]|nr:biotin--[acetyl-CoA-carboxylase] ligase [SAR86 cluster bacterium]